MSVSSRDDRRRDVSLQQSLSEVDLPAARKGWGQLCLVRRRRLSLGPEAERQGVDLES